MPQSTGRNRRARRSALEPCEDRILQSVTAGPVGPAAQPQETVSTAVGSRIVLVYEAAHDHASGIFDDPFFFDAN
jgi:hypothetical protein